MKVKVHWIVDGIADVEAKNQEETRLCFLRAMPWRFD